LTDLGAYLVQRLMDNHMLIELDHLSEQARLTVLQMAEARHYPLVSSHTNTGGIWTPSDLRRLYALGGFATARPDTAEKLAKTILSFQDYVRPGQFLGVGLGTDTGGFNASPAPDPSAASKPLHYPFSSYDGNVKFVCQLSGRRVFNLNQDGVAHYGLYADLLAYMRQQNGGDAASRLLFRSAEGYLRTWEAATGVGGAGAGGGAPAPVITSASLSAKAFRAADRGAGLTGRRNKQQRKTGTDVRYRDSQPATTTFALLKPAVGHMRVLSLGSFAHRDRAGSVRVHFTGRVGGRKLPPGRYLLALTPRADGKTGGTVQLAFRIIK
jgi:hypothetical protein